MPPSPNEVNVMLNIEQLTISAFRGIPGDLSLVFDTPLTVLCAPNGTGKTSICDAIEWLLTEHVQRLDNTDDSANAMGWRCAFAKPEVRTQVSANVTRGTKSLRIVRSHDPEDLWVYESGSIRHQWQPGKLLEWLAPHAAPESLKPNARIVRQRHWLSSTHLLSTERFGILLDTDSRCQQARQELFADLIGVGELERTRLRVDKVSKGLEKALQGAMDQVLLASLRLSTLETQLKQSGSLPTLEAVKESLYGMVVDLGLPTSNPVDIQQDGELGEAVAKLKDIVSTKKVELESDASLWQIIETRLGFDEGRATAVEAAKSELPAIRAKLTNLRKEIKRLEEDIATLEARKASCSERSQSLGKDLAALQAAMLSLADYAVRKQVSHFSVNELIEHLGSMSSSDIDTAIEKVNLARGMASRMKEIVDRSIELNTQILALPTDQTLRQRNAECQRRLDTARQSRIHLDAERASLSGAAERLVALGREITGHGPQSSKCPLCGHNWGDAQALLGAIDRMSTALGPQVASVSIRLDEAINTLKIAEKTASEIAIQVTQRQSLEVEVGQLLQEIRQYRELLFAAGIQQSELPSGAFLDEVIAELRARRAAANSIQQIHEVWVSLPLNVVEDNWYSVLHAYEDVLRLRIAKVVTESEDISSSHSASRNLLADKSQMAAAATASISALEALLTEATDIASRADAAAASLSLHLPLERQTVNASRSKWLIQLDKVKRAEATLLSTSESLLLVQQHEEICRLRAAHEVAKQEVSRLEQQKERVQQVSAFVKEALVSAKCERLASIQHGVQSLFLRMHANRVFDAIIATEDAAGFGAVVEEEFFRSEDLSQGQRQDLALAIFISRARAYGGTFFLDEPLLHLDDLNRLALLDVLRAIAIQDGPRMRLVVTTASSHVLSHIQQKFEGVKDVEGKALLRAYCLAGTAKEGIQAKLLP